MRKSSNRAGLRVFASPFLVNGKWGWEWIWE